MGAESSKESHVAEVVVDVMKTLWLVRQEGLEKIVEAQTKLEAVEKVVELHFEYLRKFSPFIEFDKIKDTTVKTIMEGIPKLDYPFGAKVSYAYQICLPTEVKFLFGAKLTELLADLDSAEQDIQCWKYNKKWYSLYPTNKVNKVLNVGFKLSHLLQTLAGQYQSPAIRTIRQLAEGVWSVYLPHGDYPRLDQKEHNKFVKAWEKVADVILSDEQNKEKRTYLETSQMAEGILKIQNSLANPSFNKEGLRKELLDITKHFGKPYSPFTIEEEMWLGELIKSVLGDA